MPTDSNNNGPVISVRAFIEDNLGNILLLRRAESQGNATGKWSFPGGIVQYAESPPISLERLILQKTGLKLRDIDFLHWKNIAPTPENKLHSLNMYFKAKCEGVLNIDSAFSDFKWVTPQELNNVKIAFMGNDAIKYYEESKRPKDEQLWNLVAEAESVSIPINRKLLIQLQSRQGDFIQLKKDFAIYHDVETNIRSKLERIQQKYKRRHEPIIVQTQTRTKDYTSLFEKMIRKGDNGVPRPYTTFDDNVGARAVVGFLKDVYTVRDELIAMTGYKVREEIDYIKNPKDTGYRGLHMTLEIPTREASFIPRCELQLRTIGEHVWATNSHALTYKNNDIPEEFIERFRKLSDTFYEADKILNEIRHDIDHLHDGDVLAASCKDEHK